MKKVRIERREIPTVVGPLLLGIFAFFLIVGPRVLNPSNIAWLAHGDFATYYLGWLFFRHSPWTFPLTLNPSYGLEFSNSILYSDSGPLLGCLFKLFSPWLPEVFQYGGIWIFICFILQAWFSWKLIGLISDNEVVRLLGAGFFVFAPPMIWRIHVHLNLVGHFLIIAALYLTFFGGMYKRKLLWGILLTIAALVHPYLLAMIIPIWVADMVSRVIKREFSIRKAIFEFFTIFTVVGIACWQAGYFSVSGGLAEGGYGIYRLNLLSLFDHKDQTGAWSYILKDIPEAPGDCEGFSFLGLGIIFLLICSLPAVFSKKVEFRKAINKYHILGIALLLLTVYAVSNKVGFGTVGFGYFLPEPILKMANIFRASGRMFWPVFYTIIFSIIFLIIRRYEKRTAISLLSLALIIQIADTHAWWGTFRHQVAMIGAKSVCDSPLTDPIWKEFASRYTKIRFIIPRNRPPNYEVFARYAATHRLATDAVYLARMDATVLKRMQDKAMKSLHTGRYESDSFYILEDKAAIQALLHINTENDAIGKINGFTVLAPGWKKEKNCSAFSDEITLKDLFSNFNLKLGEKILFNQPQPYLAEGWSSVESWGTWSEGPQGSIILPFNQGSEATLLIIEANPLLISTLIIKQTIEISINGIPIDNVILTASSSKNFQINIPEKARKLASEKGLLIVKFNFPNAVRPKDLKGRGINNDERELALGLISLTAI